MWSSVCREDLVSIKMLHSWCYELMRCKVMTRCQRSCRGIISPAFKCVTKHIMGFIFFLFCFRNCRIMLCLWLYRSHGMTHLSIKIYWWCFFYTFVLPLFQYHMVAIVQSLRRKRLPFIFLLYITIRLMVLIRCQQVQQMLKFFCLFVFLCWFPLINLFSTFFMVDYTSLPWCV